MKPTAIAKGEVDRYKAFGCGFRVARFELQDSSLFPGLVRRGHKTLSVVILSGAGVRRSGLVRVEGP
jgi:hypothetical protein